MVTGGSTPAEGLPGERSCGDLDPSVVLKLADDGDWGPEGTSHLLTCESGLRGLAGRDVSLAEALESPDGELQLARDVFLHCLLRAAARESPPWEDWMRSSTRAAMQVRRPCCMIG